MDKRALKILFNLYWSSAGWLPDAGRGWDRHLALSPEEFDCGKQAGILFDPVAISHADAIPRARSVRDAVDARAVADGFLASLSSRRLDLRSALGSYAVLRYLDDHPAPPPRQLCPVCGLYATYEEPRDLNVLNFERYKWGGVRHDQIDYATFDLEQFHRFERPIPTADDTAILQRLLDAIRSVPAKTSAAELEKFLSPVLRSNKAERDAVVAILGLCGILNAAPHESYFARFIRWDERELPPRRFADMAYPACWWQGSDGIDDAVVRFYFGHALNAVGKTC